MTTAQEIDVETFTVPEFIEPTVPKYPSRAASRGGEGLVYVEFMVDTEGRAFDPLVVESTGDDSFHDAAIDALLESRFQPAELAGEAIIGSKRMLYRFDLEQEGDVGASPEFTSAYRRFQRDLARADRERIESTLDRLENLGAINHYEYAFLGLARYSHALLYGTEREQLEHLRQSLSISSSPDDPQYLDETIVRDLLRAQLTLQLRSNFFGEALITFASMEAADDTEGVASFASVIETVRAMRLDDSEYVIPFDLDESGYTSIRLFKHNFAMTGGEGGLNEVVLRCDRQYVAFQIERDISYDVPPDWGDCSLQIVGDAGASFFLLQH